MRIVVWWAGALTFSRSCVPGILNSIVGEPTEEVSVTSEEALLSLKQL